MQRSVVIKKDGWRFAPAPSLPVLPAGQEKQEKREEKAAEESEPKLRLIHDSGRIKKIIITCSCGEELELVCAYNENEGVGFADTGKEEKR